MALPERRILKFEQLDSTNNYTAKAIRTGEYVEGTVILAHYQTDGRGQRGSKWQSDPGVNLTFSFGIQVSFLAMHQQFLIAKAISAGIAHHLRTLIGNEVYIKWPNDILAGDKKIAGLLIEFINTTHKWCIVGVGINVNQTYFAPGIKATSVRNELGGEVSLAPLLDALLDAMYSRIDSLKEGNDTVLQAEYMEALYGCGQWVPMRTSGQSFQGTIHHVDHTGIIFVKNRQGRLSEHRVKELQISY